MPFLKDIYGSVAAPLVEAEAEDEQQVGKEEGKEDKTAPASPVRVQSCEDLPSRRKLLVRLRHLIIPTVATNLSKKVEPAVPIVRDFFSASNEIMPKASELEEGKIEEENGQGGVPDAVEDIDEDASLPFLDLPENELLSKILNHALKMNNKLNTYKPVLDLACEELEARKADYAEGDNGKNGLLVKKLEEWGQILEEAIRNYTQSSSAVRKNYIRRVLGVKEEEIKISATQKKAMVSRLEAE